MNNITELYRYEDDGDEDGSVRLYLRALPIVKRTLCGYRVLLWGDWQSKHCKTRLVIDGACRPYALPTKDAALDHYRQRKERQVKALECRLECAKRYIDLAKDADLKGGAT